MRGNLRIIMLLLTLLTGLLMWLGWPPFKFSFLIFVGLVPVFVIERILVQRNSTIWFGSFAYLAMLHFNLLTTWWVGNASAGGAIAMILANSLLMTLPFLGYRWTKSLVGESKAFIGFVLFWLSIEHLHFSWDLAFPWLTLGNAFATSTNIIQWYSYTGVFGGSLWILIVNVMVFRLIMEPTRRKSVWLGAVLLAPLLWSMFIQLRFEERSERSIDLVVVQPNIDPYNKFDESTEVTNVKKFLELIDSSIDRSTDLIVLPETAIVGNMDEDRMENSEKIALIRSYLQRYPDVQLLTGAETYRFYKEGEERQPSVRTTSWGEDWEAYNTALLIDQNGVKDVYHKSILVPGVEKMPYPKFFKFLEKYTLDLGGTTGSLGKNSAAETFNVKYRMATGENTDTTYATNVTPLICYESVFGNYIREFGKEDLGLIFVITNDGWWKNTAGYQQHMHYARLRAIESRRYVVRSANTGISCVIDAQGQIIDHTGWWETVARRWTVPVMEGEQTFYTKNGDSIAKIAVFLTILFALSLFVKKLMKKAL